MLTPDQVNVLRAIGVPVEHDRVAHQYQLTIAELRVAQDAGLAVQYSGPLEFRGAEEWQSSTRGWAFTGEGRYRLHPRYFEPEHRPVEGPTIVQNHVEAQAGELVRLRDQVADLQRQLETERANYIARDNELKNLRDELSVVDSQRDNLILQRDAFEQAVARLRGKLSAVREVIGT